MWCDVTVIFPNYDRLHTFGQKCLTCALNLQQVYGQLPIHLLASRPVYHALEAVLCSAAITGCYCQK